MSAKSSRFGHHGGQGAATKPPPLPGKRSATTPGKAPPRYPGKRSRTQSLRPAKPPAP